VKKKLVQPQLQEHHVLTLQHCSALKTLLASHTQKVGVISSFNLSDPAKKADFKLYDLKARDEHA